MARTESKQIMGFLKIDTKHHDAIISLIVTPFEGVLAGGGAGVPGVLSGPSCRQSRDSAVRRGGTFTCQKITLTQSDARFADRSGMRISIRPVPVREPHLPLA